jgi:hypothetical protein
VAATLHDIYIYIIWSLGRNPFLIYIYCLNMDYVIGVLSINRFNLFSISSSFDYLIGTLTIKLKVHQKKTIKLINCMRSEKDI